MPERPKRRKNNKNKRKNKNSRLEVKGSVATESLSSEQCNESTDLPNTSEVVDVPENKSVIGNEEIQNSVVENELPLESQKHEVTDKIVILEDEKLRDSCDNCSGSATISNIESGRNENKIAPEKLSIFSDDIVPQRIDCVVKEVVQGVTAYSDDFQLINDKIKGKNRPVIEEINLQSLCLNKYVVESPDQTLKNKSKLTGTAKSKSLDNDDIPKIVDVTEECQSQIEDDNNLSIIDTSNVLISDVESDVEWEKTDDLEHEQNSVVETIAVDNILTSTVPLNKAKCQETKSLTPEEETSLRCYLQTLDLATNPSDSDSIEIKEEIEHIISREIRHRLRKKAVAEDFLSQRLGAPRMLDVIDEEGSGESSLASRRQSYLSDKKSDTEDLDDVFEENDKCLVNIRTINKPQNLALRPLVPQPCLLVGTKIKEPEISEARGDWTMKTLEKMTGAELIYLTDSSSSTSSIHDVSEETDDSADTDLSVRMITPTIEVTDTENLLKKTFLKNDDDKPQCSLSSIDINLEDNLNKELKNSQSAHFPENFHDRKCILDNDNNGHVIEVLQTDNIKTNLYVKDLNEPDLNQINISDSSKGISDKRKDLKISKKVDNYSTEMKVLKCELNDAINNLIKEVAPDTESNNNNDNTQVTLTRQDSSSSICSSQCTAKYNPTSSSLNDVSNILHDDICENNKTENRKVESIANHVKDVFEHVAEFSAQNKWQDYAFIKQPVALRDLCVKKIAAFPYGEKILEELADVSKRLQNITVFGSNSNITGITKQEHVKNQTRKESDMPHFSSSGLSSIEKVALHKKHKTADPPPVKPRHSSLKKSQDDHWSGLPAKSEPVYICLSPSQKMLMEKTNTVITKEDASRLVDTHNKNMNHSGYKDSSRHEEKSKHEYKDPPSIVPFKSQTGSRLLALICDPNVTHHAIKNSDFSNRSLDQLNKYHVRKETTQHRSQEKIDFSKTFKPIPPPRPRKIASSFYESDESSDFNDNSLHSMRSERKVFHYSTGNLNKEIENDISSIQNMHRYCKNIRDEINDQCPRRPSLPKDLCDQQMEYIKQKEKEVEAELQRLERQNVFEQSQQRRGPRAPMISEKETYEEKVTGANNFYNLSKKEIFSFHSKPVDIRERGNLSSLFSSSQEELLRDKMYSEYVSQMAERQERKQHKIIKITNTPPAKCDKEFSKSMPALDILDYKVNNRIEKEFISKARERWNKLGITDPETEDEREEIRKHVYREPKVIEHKIKVLEDGEEKDVKKLPNHLQEFVRFTAKEKAEGTSRSPETVMIAPTFKARSTSPAVWRPGAPTPPPAPPSAPAPALSLARSPGGPPPPPPPPVWTPGSAGASPQAPRKPFRPVHFEETPPARRKFMNLEQNGCTSGSESEGRLRTSHSAPATGLSTLGGAATTSRLPRAQNPTVTLLQKAREGQLQGRGASYQQQERDSARLPRDRASPPKSDPVHALRREYASEGEVERSEYVRGGPRIMADAHRKVDGIGPTTKEGMPVALRSEVKDPSRWYKKMYDTIHKNKFDDDYVTIRYKNRRGQPPQRVNNKSQYAYFDPRSGYLSEPEGGLNRLGSSTWSDAYDSDAVSTGPRRRTASVQEDRRNDDVTSPYPPSNKYSTLASARASQEIYRNQPGRIENYVPGRSSVIDKEAKQWWDEVMDIFDGWLDDNSPLPPYSTLLARAIQKNQISNTSTTSLPQASPKEKKDVTSAILAKSNMARALKESGYESDSTLVFRRREDTEAPLSPAERRAAYRDLQAGGEPPLRGFRSPAPPRQDESEIEYIPISPTLTKIRIHKKTPAFHEVICYPVTSIESEIQSKTKKPVSSFVRIDIPPKVINHPPAPPRRVSSRNSRTLKLVASTKPVLSSMRSASTGTQSNVDRLKDKISNKLRRQNTHILNKTNVEPSLYQKLSKSRAIMSTSAPPAVNRKQMGNLCNNYQITSNVPKKTGTSSFSSPRRTLLPSDYSNSIHTKYGDRSASIVIDGGVGRKTPISNILDKVTTLDKLWSSEKRNERIDMSKIKAKVASKPNSLNASVSKLSKAPTMTTHRGRDMVRTAEKVQKLKFTNACTKSMPYLMAKNESKSLKSSYIQNTKGLSKSTINVSGNSKKQTEVKTAIVTNLKKKKTNDSIMIRPRSVPCHESCSKKTKDVNKNHKKTNKEKQHKKVIKLYEESESESQFGDTSNEVSNFGSVENLEKKNVGLKEIKKMHDAVVSDSFFQHLFLGGSCAPTIAYPLLEQTSVLQKAKMFQTFPQSNQSAKSLNTYLIHRKPVSLSRFKVWDRYISPTRDQSPRSISWPGRKHANIRKFNSLTKDDEFGSTSSLNSVRSKSEPPINKIYFSQTSRPKSPTVVFYKKDNTQNSSIKTSKPSARLFFSQTSRPVSPKVDRKCINPETESNSVSPTRLILTETVRPISPSMIKNPKPKLYVTEITADEELQPSTLFFSQTSRPVSPKVIMKSRSHSSSPVSVRSPSYRRIHSARLQSSTQPNNTLEKRVFRTRSAGDAEKGYAQSNVTVKTKSVPNLNVNDPDYNEYIWDMENTKARSERFRELNRYYTYLERVSELEKTTSTCDLRHRKKDEEIIDFDRWKKIRAIERAEEELNILYYKLKVAQSEKDVLFYPRDLDDYRWNHNKDRGLRIKEKSVEDLKEQFQQTSPCDSMDMDRSSNKDTYKPLWRGTSVAETAFNINRQSKTNNNTVTRAKRPSVALQKDYSLSDLRKKIGIGNHLWSSLSIEQVNALKNQLNAIYSKELEAKNNDIQKYAIDVDDTKSIGKSMLHVRSNSLITSNRPPLERNELSKSKSIAAIACPITSMKELKNNVNKIQMSLSENDKRKISQTLSKEILSRINKLDNSVSLSIDLNSTKEKDESLRTQYDPRTKDHLSILPTTSITETDNITDNKFKDQKRHVIFPSNHTEPVHLSSASETETASSDASSKTVIYRGPIKQVQKKVEYFESVKNSNNQINTTHHVKNISDETEENDKLVFTAPTVMNKNDVPKSQIVQSQSCANLKELFGESEKNKYLSLPSKCEMYSRSPSPYSEVNITEQPLPDTEGYLSDETIRRSRSPSPDPERYWRAYLNLARAGEVRRLARRFDSPPSRGTLRRHRSDPEIARSTFLQNWSSIVQEKQKQMLPVARVPLRSTNRLMPHIDIISKLAALRKRITPRSRSAEEALECRVGEVDRIRRRFEAMSLLGQIYASAPDVSELRDIAQYLEGAWIAHRYPNRSDNNKSIKDPCSFVGGKKSPVTKEVKILAPKESLKLSSILKSDAHAKQEFDPAAHRPASRYVPPQAPPRPPPASWPYCLVPYVMPSRHSVKFKENDLAPEPPSRSAYGSYSDTESPRRYVESDVNIHYRCPVRHDPLPLVPERELARQQAEHMKRLYREQKRNKYLQELQDMQNRRHQDNFTPSQKTVVPLNRYDEAERIVAKALYTFNGQTSRELSFRKGDLINVRRQIDANWYEGEVNGRIGLFPYNYIELVKGDVPQSPKKPVTLEGRARAKFDFTAQTNLELPLKKGEVVVLTRRIDQNWWEGRNGNKTGIFPDSYVTVLQEPSQNKPEPHSVQSAPSDKPMASPAAHGLLNGSAKRSMGSHSYTPQPNSPALSNAPQPTQPLPGYMAKPAQATLSASERGYGPPTTPGVDLNNTEPLYVDTNAEAVPYRAMYKYRPQNPDELELNEGDTVYVLEKCDDGWYVGSSQRTGRFGTFPGNYVERI